VSKNNCFKPLYARFRVSFDNAQNGFRDFIDDGGVRVTAGLAKLDTAISKHYQFLQQMLNGGSVLLAMIYAIAHSFKNFLTYVCEFGWHVTGNISAAVIRETVAA